jgi:hypothetical protein
MKWLEWQGWNTKKTMKKLGWKVMVFGWSSRDERKWRRWGGNVKKIYIQMFTSLWMKNEKRWRSWAVDEEIGKKNMERVGLEKDEVVCLGKIAT